MKMPKTILLIATLDTKGQEALFVKNLIEERGVRTLVMDVGVTGKSPLRADFPNPEVAGAASRTLQELLSYGDEARAMDEMAKGAERIVAEHFEKGDFDGVIALGGTMGTALALRVFRKLPIGVTKVLASTVALSYFVTPQAVHSDIVMVQVASDLWGLNRVVKKDLTKAAVESEDEGQEEGAPFIAMTTLGGSYLKYASPVKAALEREGYEVAIFHSVSMQGAIMERLIMEGRVDGVLDLCPQEVLTEHCGGYCCSPGRLKAAAQMGIPQVVAPGGIGAFPWGSLEDLPERFKGRPAKWHNEIASAIKATKGELAEVARIMARRLNRSKGPVAVVIPEDGFFEYDRPGAFFYDPEGRRLFVNTLRDELNPDIEFESMDCHINDPEYAKRVSDIAFRILP
jgi:uncharacterized protein (UPF0261 family)